MSATALTRVRFVLTPGTKLVGRLRYAQKFVLIGLVLIAPLGFVLKSFLDQQSSQIGFSTEERVGVVYVTPASQVLAKVVAARAAAVDAAAHTGSTAALTSAETAVRAAIGPLDAANAQVGAALKVSSEWSSIKQQLSRALASPTSSPNTVLTQFDAVTAALLKLIVDAGNNSNLILDPDLDSFYIMDSVINRIPLLVDAAGQAGDMQTAMNAGGSVSIVKRIQLAVLKGNIQTTLANNDANYVTALGNTKDTALKPELSGPIAATDKALKAVAANLTSAVTTGKLDAVGATRLATAAAATLTVLDRLSLPALDHLLAVRISGFQSTATQVKLIAALGVLLAIYLFICFYFSVRGSQATILEGLTVLEERCTDPLGEGMEAMAAGDLTRRIVADAPPIQPTTRDELGRVVSAVNRIRERILSSIQAYNAMSDQLRSMIGEVSVSAGAVGAASQQVSTNSQEAGDASSEIARAVGEVAEGAERQVTMIEQARNAASEAGEVVAESARSAHETVSVAQEAREAVAAGVAAAAEATDAMGSVRDSSTAVTSAIGELADKSEQIGAIVQTITGIAEQTNLLALNAAIEAARAGEQGRGFAVVAEEVRKLAEESQNAAKEISTLVGAIQVETSNTVDVVRDGRERTEQGASVVAQTREAFERIGATVDEVTARIEQIARFSEQIDAAVSKTHASITEIAAVAEESSAAAEEVSATTEQTSASTQQIAASAHELASTAGVLQEMVTRFRLSE